MDKKILLIVEDDRGIRESLVEILGLEGFTVISAENGADGLEKLKQSQVRPNLIVLDLMMPVKDGYQFRKEQEEDHRYADIPVVLLSADGHIEEKKMRIGAKAYIKKPVDIDVLVDSIKKYAL